MKRNIFLLTISLFIVLQAKSQAVSQAQFQKLIGYLNQENWQQAATLSKFYLASIPKADQDGSTASILRYMFITSESGLMNARKVSQQQALKAVESFVGLGLVFPWRQLSFKSGFNYIELLDTKKIKTDTLMVTSANKAADEILSFEYLIPKQTFSLLQFTAGVGKLCRVRGRLKAIRVDGHGLPRYRMLIDNAEFSMKE